MEEKKLVPKLRFPGFTEPWEQRKLGEIVKIERGGSPRPIDNYITTDADGLNWIKIGDAPEQGRYIVHAAEKIKPLGLSKTRQVEPGDLILSNSMSFGKPYIMSIHGCIHDGWLLIRNNQNIFDLKFLCNLLGTEQLHAQYRRLAAGSAVNNLNKELVSGTNVGVPSKAEQLKIGQFFENLDEYITLHQRKLEHLKLKKKSLLQKLFPKEGEVYPELRFPGFTDPWEQRKLGEIVERITRKNNEQSDRPLTISAQDGLVDQCEYFDRQVASRDMSNYYLIKKGEFAYNKSYSDGYPFGAIKRLDYYDKGALSTLYIIFKIVDGRIDSDFMVAYYMTSLWHKEISKRAAEGARNHGLLNISTEDFFNSELKIPNDIKEQIKVGKFINQFDQYITLHQRKLEHLQLLKKALLQQLFV